MWTQEGFIGLSFFLFWQLGVSLLKMVISFPYAVHPRFILQLARLIISDYPIFMSYVHIFVDYIYFGYSYVCRLAQNQIIHDLVFGKDYCLAYPEKCACWFMKNPNRFLGCQMLCQCLWIIGGRVSKRQYLYLTHLKSKLQEVFNTAPLISSMVISGCSSDAWLMTPRCKRTRAYPFLLVASI